MSRYGLTLYGTDVYGEAPLLEFDVAPFEADAEGDYGSLTLTWMSPSGDYDQFRLLRSSYGQPTDELDGDILLDIDTTTSAAPTRYVDQGGTASEIQQVWVEAVGGTFTLTFVGQTTAAIAYNATAPQVEAALEALSNIDDVSVWGSGTATDPWRILFGGSLAETNVSPLTGDGTSLTGAARVVVAVEQQGGEPLGLTQGVFYYYAIFLHDTVQLKWWKAGVATGLVLKDWGYSDRVYELLPETFREQDTQIPDQPLRRFCSGFGYGYDHLRTEYETLLWVNDIDRISGGLLPVLSDQLGLTYEPELGMRQMRRWLRTAVYLYKVKGTRNGIEGTVSAITNWGAEIAIGKNLLLDTNSGTFSTGVGQWEAITNATVAQVTNAPIESTVGGAGQLRVTSVAAGDMVVGMVGSGQSARLYGIPVIEATAYTASIYALANSVQRGVAVDIVWYDDTDAVISTSSGTATNDNLAAATDFSRHTTTATSPAGAIRADVRARIVGTGGAGEIHFLDAAQVEQAGAASAYQTPRDVRITVLPERANLVPNPSFEVNTTGWVAGNADTTIARSTAAAYSGTATGTLTSPGAGSGPWDLAINTLSGTSGIPVLPSTTYVFSGYMQAAAVAGSGRQVRLDYTFYDSGGSIVGIYTVGSSTFTTTDSDWVRPYEVVTTPPTAAFVRLTFVVLAVNTNTEVHRVDAVMVERGSELRSYFDASFTPLADYLWGGTTHNSTSYQYRRRTTKNQRLNALLPEYMPLGSTFTLLYAQP